MKTPNLAKVAVDTQAAALAALLNGGYIDIYDGEQPEFADTPLSGQRRGVSLQLATPAFAPPQNGKMQAYPISSAMVSASIKATWARVCRSDRTPVMDVSVGTKDANMILPTITLVQGIVVSCSSFVHVVPQAAPSS